MTAANHFVYYACISMVVVTGICMNVFFAVCMLSDQLKSFKPPLSVLVGTAVFHNILLQVSVFVFTFNKFFNLDLMHVMAMMVGFIIYAGLSVMSTNVWLSVFYYTKIVSSPSAVLAWIKRNITTVVYGGLVMDKIYLVSLVLTLIMAQKMAQIHAGSNTQTHNNSNSSNPSVGNATAVDHYLSPWTYVANAFVHFHLFYLSLFITLMFWAWGCTSVYLCRHIRRMEGSASPFSSPQVRCQVRVAIQGIVQTALYAICAMGQFLTLFPMWLNLDAEARAMVHNVSVAFYALGTTINLGCGQHLFREKTVQILASVKSGTCWKCKRKG